jgi:hypothetical protein
MLILTIDALLLREGLRFSLFYLPLQLISFAGLCLGIYLFEGHRCRVRKLDNLFGRSGWDFKEIGRKIYLHPFTNVTT